MQRIRVLGFSVLAISTWLSSALPSQADFTAYNDLKWASGQTNAWITTFNPVDNPGGGSLVDYNTHATLGVSVSFSGTANLFDNSVTAPPGGSDAYTTFNGIVDQNGYTYFNTGDVTMTIAGLDPAKTYEFSFFSTRGGASPAYSNRQTHVTISSVSAFTNQSSAGSVVYTTNVANDSTYIVSANLDGKLVRYVGVNPGPDGTIVFTVRGVGTGGEGNIGYGNAFQLKEIDPAGSEQGGYIAYNDAAWHQDASIFGGQGVEPAPVNYTTNTLWGQVSGALVSDSGQPLSAQVSFSGSPLGLGMLARNFSLPDATDLSILFAGKIGTNNALSWTGGVVTMTLSGLDSSKAYTLAIWSSRGGTTASYSNRWTDITIKSVDVFTNASSAGLATFTTTTANDSTRVVAVIEGGRLARFDGVKPGVDGTIVVDLTANGLTPADVNGYLNAFMLQEYAGVVIPVAPSIANGAPTGIGANAATLVGSMSSTGSLPTQVWAFWKAGSDGGTSKVNWTYSTALGYRTAGSLAYLATALSSNMTYYYRYYASNSAGQTWATTPQSFTTTSGVVSGPTNTIKIMCIGDSITQSASNYPSFRYWLWKLLTVSNNYNVNFIGEKTTGVDGPNIYSDFDQDHAGYWGWASWAVDTVLQTNTYYSTNVPDIALIHLGHNDVGWQDQGQGPTGSTNGIAILINHLRQRNTNMVILLAQIIPVNPALNTGDPTFATEVDQVAALIPTLAASKTLPSSPVIAVDQHTGFDATNDTWASDGIHPTVSGEKKIAAKWFTALQSWLPNLTVTNDADLNGMSDGWEVYYFGEYGQSPTADPDGDGLNNQEEYIVGSSPLGASAGPMFEQSAPGAFGIDTISQRVYQVDMRTNLVLGSWQLYTNITGDGTEKALPITNSPVPGIFYRYKVRMAP